MGDESNQVRGGVTKRPVGGTFVGERPVLHLLVLESHPVGLHGHFDAPDS